MKAAPNVVRTKDFVADAAGLILEHARKAITERNEFRVALSGGNTPAPVYAHIAAETRDFPWESVRFTFGDERCVPPDNPESNFRMARENLFVPAAVPDRSIMRMRGEIDPQIAAQEYEDELNALAAKRGEPIYKHDLILLGLGDDGHTASLCPGTSALDELSALGAKRGEPIYKHDWILLGLGDDGHTASLFPGPSALDELSALGAKRGEPIYKHDLIGSPR